MPSNIPATPLYYQQLEKTFNLNLLLHDIEKLYSNSVQVQPSHDETDEEFDVWKPTSTVSLSSKLKQPKRGRKSEKPRFYNFSRVGIDRQWLQNLLVNDDSTESSSDESVTEEEIKREMKLHHLRKKYRRYFYARVDNKNFKYYSAGLLSMVDVYNNPDSHHPKGNSKNNYRIHTGKRVYDKTRKYCKTTSKSTQKTIPKRTKNHAKMKPEAYPKKLGIIGKQLKKGLKREASKSEVMAARRRKLWAVLVKNDILKVRSYRVNRFKEAGKNLKQIAQNCLKHARRKATHSEKYVKKIPHRARRLIRQMQAY